MRLRALLVAALLLITSPAWAAVAKDAVITAGNSADSSAIQVAGTTDTGNVTGITVGAGATGLVAVVCYQSSIAAPTTRALTWNGTSMTEARFDSINSGGTFEATSVFVLANPASGLKNFHLTFANAADIYIGAVSVTGSDTSTVVKNADSTGQTTSGGGTMTLTVTSSTDGMTVATFCANGNAPTVNFTQFWDDQALNPGGAGSYNLGGTSNGHTFTGGGLLQSASGVHVIAPAAAGAPKFIPEQYFPSPMGPHQL